MRYLFFLVIIFPLISCTTHPHSEGRDEYIRKIDTNSAGDKQFAGLYHNFEFRATLLTQDVSKTIHDRMDKYYDWSDEESEKNWQKRQEEMSKQTTLWLSFFTPERKDDNLANKVSIWKVYLEADGRRFEGKPRKANKNLSEAKALFHYHTRWSSPYYVDFPVATGEIENSNKKLVITGPLGRREVAFSRSYE